MQFGKNQRRVVRDLKNGCHLGWHINLDTNEEQAWITDDEKSDYFEISLKMLNSLFKKYVITGFMEMSTVSPAPNTETWRYDLDKSELFELWFPSCIGDVGYWEEMTDRQPEVHE